MSSYHYTITSKKKAKEYNSNKKKHKDYLIEDVTELIENNNPKYSPISIYKGRKNIFLNVVMFLAIIDFILLLLVCIVGKDLLNLQENFYKLTSNMVAFAGILLTLISIPNIKEKVSHIFFFGNCGNKLVISLLTLFGGFLIAIIFFFKLNSELANLVSLIGILICMFSFQ